MREVGSGGFRLDGWLVKGGRSISLMDCFLGDFRTETDLCSLKTDRPAQEEGVEGSPLRCGVHDVPAKLEYHSLTSLLL